MKDWKRLLSLALCICMLLSMMPNWAIGVHAEDDEEEQTVVQEEQAQEEEPETAEEAVEEEGLEEAEEPAEQEEIEDESEEDDTTGEEELPENSEEKDNEKQYPWDGMTDEEFAEWVMAEENCVFVESILNGDDVRYDALSARVERLDDDLYEMVSAYLSIHISGEAITFAAFEENESYLWPVPSYHGITSNRGYSSTHKGIDIPGAEGAWIYATRSGVVDIVYSGCKNRNGLSSGGIPCNRKGICQPSTGKYNDYGFCNGGNGNGVVIRHTNNDGTVSYSFYAHMLQNSVTVYVGQKVERGQAIGKIGCSGYANGAHLHFTLSSADKYAFDINNNVGVIAYDYDSSAYKNYSGDTKAIFFSDESATVLSDNSAKTTSSWHNPNGIRLNYAGIFWSENELNDKTPTAAELLSNDSNLAFGKIVEEVGEAYKTISTATFTETIQNAKSGTRYCVKSFVIDSNGNVYYSTEPYYFTTTGISISPPQNVVISQRNMSVRVTFDRVSNATSYDVYMVQEPWGWEDIKYSQTTTENMVQFDGVEVGGYAVFVIARNGSMQSSQSEWKNIFVTTPAFEVSVNANGGTDAVQPWSLFYGEQIVINSAMVLKAGYELKGWNLYRPGDEKWFTSGQGWKTESEIAQNGFSKELYPADVTMNIDMSFLWNNGETKISSFVFYAVWEECPPVDEDTVDSGICGEKLTWTLDKNGVLTISGNGEMENYNYTFDTEGRMTSTSPWGQYRDIIESVVIENGVKSIGDYAFTECREITRVSIPDSVAALGDSSFIYCTGITNITLPDGITKISAGAFFCTGLTSFRIPESVTEIGSSAFYRCSELTTISIPESVTHIDSLAFAYCSKLKTIDVAEDNPMYMSLNGVLFTKNGETLVQCPAARLRGYTVPEGVITIGDGAFHGCSKLTAITLPNSVTTIGGMMFAGCSSLTEMNIPAGVTYIGAHAFEACDRLSDIYYSGSQMDWNKIEIDKFNPALNTATIHYEKEETEQEVTLGFTNVKTGAGKEFTVSLDLSNNSGIAGLAISLNYDKTVFTLKSVKNNGMFDSLSNGVNIVLDNAANVTENGVIAALTFVVNENAQEGEYPISAVVRSCVNEDGKDVPIKVNAGTVTIVNVVYGDANGDEKIDMKDVVLLRKFITNFDYDTGVSSVATEAGADANGDGKIDMKDVVLLRKYITNYDYDTGTSTVVLGPQ